jgi:hypothetical protein
VDLEDERQACERLADEVLASHRAAQAEGQHQGGTAQEGASTHPASQVLRTGRRPSRHIPAAILAHIEHRSGGFCEQGDCRAPATRFHHRERFALRPRHGPDDIIHLCRDHEYHAHAGDYENEGDPPAQWRIRLDRQVRTADEAARARIDAKVRARRRPPEPAIGAAADATRPAGERATERASERTSGSSSERVGRQYRGRTAADRRTPQRK